MRMFTFEGQLSAAIDIGDHDFRVRDYRGCSGRDRVYNGFSILLSRSGWPVSRIPKRKRAKNCGKGDKLAWTLDPSVRLEG